MFSAVKPYLALFGPRESQRVMSVDMRISIIPRIAWDPAILGIMLILISTLITRWLSRGPNKARYGFTAENILKPESHGINLTDLGAALTPVFVDSQQPPAQAEKYFDGGKSGGG